MTNSWKQENLFDFSPEIDPDRIEFDVLPHRIWTEHKARLVERYLYYFVFITHHGTYIDGFAGQQYPGQDRSWAAREVIESRPRWLRNFFLNDIDSDRVTELRQLVERQEPPNRDKSEQPRRIEVNEGDFNEWVDSVLASGVIHENEAAFALLDQRTFECRWSTVEKLARHKSRNKVELFYFLPAKWLHRALSKKLDLCQVASWWGNQDWAQLGSASQDSIRDAATRRFKQDLGYRFVYAWPIYSETDGEGAVMYYMIHASDDPRAPKLMHRAYKNALGAREPVEQLQIELSPKG